MATLEAAVHHVTDLAKQYLRGVNAEDPESYDVDDDDDDDSRDDFDN